MPDVGVFRDVQVAVPKTLAPKKVKKSGRAPLARAVSWWTPASRRAEHVLTTAILSVAAAWVLIVAGLVTLLDRENEDASVS
jgi:hypothetical protein